MDADNNNFDEYINGLISQGSMPFSEGVGDYTLPSMYKLFLTDIIDTPSDSISFVMSNLFHKSDFESDKVIKKLEKEHKLLCGTYTKDVAETKVLEVAEYALDNGYTFKCVIQKGKQNVIEKS